ncbi:MAG: DUF4337 domain-containing protein [Deltaproteobacteria bacterium]|nr:MAG: DUF4337 domain-containing protein [Deltaproteobacteria bacterium]
MSGVGHGHGEHGEGGNKKIALLIAVLALLLAFSATLGKSAQTSAIRYNIEAANMWAFFQAKTIRMTAVRTAAEGLEAGLPGVTDSKLKEAYEKRIEDWKKTAARYDSEPETKEGRKELVARAKIAEQNHHRALAAYHWYELSSAALEIGIVLASAGIITGIAALPWISSGLGVVGIVLALIGLLAPQAIHLF